MKMISELHRSRQGSNKQSVAVLAGRIGARHFASRAVPKTVQLNRLTLRWVGAFVRHAASINIASDCALPFVSVHRITPHALV
jgi:hypothetical protein